MSVLYPLKVASGGRYLVDQNNVPFLLLADSAWNLMPDLSVAQAQTYFADRQSNGFNAVFCPMIDSQQNVGATCPANMGTTDGIVPFTSGTATASSNTYDIAFPNNAYFTRVLNIINAAASFGIVIILNLLENYGWGANYASAGATKCQTFGAYLGTFFSGVTNLMWTYGNDYQTWSTNTALESALAGLVAGVKSTESPAHLHYGIELNFTTSSSFDDSNWTGLDANQMYCYVPTYAGVFHAYAQSTKPCYLGETTYDEIFNSSIDSGGPSNGNANAAGNSVVRRQSAWALTSGGCFGYLYGVYWSTYFPSGWTTANLDTATVKAVNRLVTVLRSRNWWKLSPDTSHLFCTAGFGTAFTYPGNVVGGSTTGTVPGNSYTTASVASDGSFGIAFVPGTSTPTTLTINMAKLGPNIQATWMDLTTGSTTIVTGGPFTNTGTKTFTSLGTNSEGFFDWLLILDAGVAYHDLLYGAVSASAKATTAESSWNQRLLSPVFGTIIEDTTTSAPGSYAATATVNSGSWAAQLVAFKALGPAPILVKPSGIPSSEAFGNPIVTSPATLTLSGIASLEAFGFSVVNDPVTLTLSGISSAERFGTMSVSGTGNVNLTLSGVPTSETFGAATVNAPATVTLTGIGSLGTFGTETVNAPANLFLAGIPSLEAFGTLNIQGTTIPVTPTGISSSESFGTLNLVNGSSPTRAIRIL